MSRKIAVAGAILPALAGSSRAEVEMSGLTMPPLIQLFNALVLLLVGEDSSNDLAATPAVTSSPVAACVVAEAMPQLADDPVQLVLAARPSAEVRITPETICAARDVIAARLANLDPEAR